MNKVILKKGREKALLRGHPWVFSGAIESISSSDPGVVLPIYSAEGNFLAQGYFNPDHSLAGRILSFQKGDVKEELRRKILEAIALRKQLFNSNTNAYRLINAEGDGIPGFIVDNYNGYLAIQVHTRGIENLKSFFLEVLVEALNPKGIYEKSLLPSREDEGLIPYQGNKYGQTPKQIEILENGLKFLVSIPNGQKTGFFLDQRLMRERMGQLSEGRNVLNCFSYTGGFSIYVLDGKAASTTSVDSCRSACQLAQENTQLNQLEHHEIIHSDVFDFLEATDFKWDVVILDPPAFAKKRRHLDNAIKGYQKLNEAVLRKLPPRSILLTCSCSYFVNEELFQRAIFTASQRAERKIQILGRHIQAPDHPVALTHPEGAYLKSLLLYVQ